MIRALAVALLFVVTLSSQGQSTQPAAVDQWKSLRFLIGKWEARTQSGSAGATGSGMYAFGLELHDHVLVRHSSNADCQGPADYNCEHADVLYIYQESPGQTFKAIYFDNEGHVINYDVSTPGPRTAVFVSPSSPSGPQFRLTYELKGRGMEGRFQMRMPGQTDFKSYLEWSGEKK